MLDRPTARVPAITANPDMGGPTNRTEPTTPLSAEVRPVDEAPGRGRRIAQVALVVGLGVVAAGLAIALPDDGSNSEEAGSTTRVEADGPTASASLLASTDRLEVEGELADAGGLAQSAALMLQLPDPSGPIAIDSAAMTNLVEPAASVGGADEAEADSATTTTTTWVEPPLPPESDWVPTGNGVLVPDVLLRIRFCESTNNYLAANSHSTARGAYQFLIGSWDWYGHAERTGVTQAHLATPAQQDQAALATLQSQGTGPWAESRPCWADPDIDPRYATATPPVAAAPTTTEATTPTTGSSSSTETTVDDTPTTTEGESTTVTTTTDDSTTTTADDSTTTTTTEATTTTAP